ncbi:MAG: hypothetical protein EBZ69_09840, partial [Alphaproteobacteria bacterium]|nr:hypothetical protein [Alphaproteobacteria bacterium]
MGPPGLPTSRETGGNRTQDSRAKEGHMKRRLDSLIHSLVMIRLGQELGSDSELAQTIAHGI